MTAAQQPEAGDGNTPPPARPVFDQAGLDIIAALGIDAYALLAHYDTQGGTQAALAIAPAVAAAAAWTRAYRTPRDQQQARVNRGGEAAVATVAALWVVVAVAVTPAGATQIIYILIVIYVISARTYRAIRHHRPAPAAAARTGDGDGPPATVHIPPATATVIHGYGDAYGDVYVPRPDDSIVTDAEPAGDTGPAGDEPRYAPPPAPRTPPPGDSCYTRPRPGTLTRGTAAPPAAGIDGNPLAEAIQQVLEDFKVDATVVDMFRAPQLDRFMLTLGHAVPVQKVKKLSDQFAFATGTDEQVVNVLAPIAGRAKVMGVEIPRPEGDRDIVRLGDILASPEAADTHPLIVALGQDMEGVPLLICLAKLPHLMVGGTSGSGKTELLRALITSILIRATPEQVRLILIDPKKVDLAVYEGIPHLLTPIITSTVKARESLEWAVAEMERRYTLLAGHGHTHIDTYNRALRDGLITRLPGEEQEPEHLPYLVIVIDELGDLMMDSPRETEQATTRLGQKARAIGIHLVLATQRFSVDIVTGVIKANIAARVALAVPSLEDSRTILGRPGAEKLTGRGDGKYKSPDSMALTRFQGAFVSLPEVRDIVAQCKAAGIQDYIDLTPPPGAGEGAAEPAGEPGADISSDLQDLLDAAELVITTQFGSTSMLQRKLRFGFAKAGRIMDLLEERFGIVGPSQRNKARIVLVKPDDMDDTLNRITEAAGE